MNSQAQDSPDPIYAPESAVVAGLLHDENKRLRGEVTRLTQENADLIHDNDLIMTACNAEANEAEELRDELDEAREERQDAYREGWCEGYGSGQAAGEDYE